MTGDCTDPRVEVDVDELTDEQLLERCARARAAEREMQAVRGLELMGAGWWDDESKLIGFMNIFHPEHPYTRDRTRPRALAKFAPRGLGR